MVTNYPQLLTAVGVASRETTVALATRTASLVGQLLCGLRGHDTVRHFEGKRMLMRCTSCGYDTPGWDIGERGPRRRFDGDDRRHALAQPRLVLRKSA